MAVVGVLLAVCRVHALHSDDGIVGVTAIDKRPVDGPVMVRRIGLHGDVQADRERHGGFDMALYAYADEAAAGWAEELGRDIPPGLFGENLRTAGIDVDGAVIGERWRIGDDVLAQVTQPRIPCATFGRRMGEPRWVKRFTQRRLPGAYLRVLVPGEIRAGDAIEVVDRPAHGIRINTWFPSPSPDHARALLDAARDSTVGVSGAMRTWAEHVVRTAG